MIRFVFFILVIFTVFQPGKTKAQQFFRIKSDYTIKYKDPKGNQIMQMGVVYYDIHSKILVMKNGFPVKEIIVQKDTSIYQIRNNYVLSKNPAYTITELSIFHLSLTGALEDYGLKKAGYILQEVKEDKGLILTTWFPPENARAYLGKILVSVKEKKLFGIVFLDPKEKIVAKHFFRDYTTINGFVFPQEVLRITYDGDKEVYNLANYSKIIINGPDEEYYNYQIPNK